MTDVIITNHAEERLKERLGLNRKSAERLAVKAYNNGIVHKGLKQGSLHKFISKECSKCKIKGTKIVLYGEFVYVV